MHRVRANHQAVIRPSGPDAEHALAQRLAAAPAIAFLLDYDGTIMPFAKTPDLARPDAPLLELLAALAKRHATHVVSGRTRESLVEFVGHLPLGLHAEHGLWSRDPVPGSGEWTRASLGDTSWLPLAKAVVDEWAARVPGAYVEGKAGGFSWHYRAADERLGRESASSVIAALERTLAGTGAEVFTGSHVVEVRPRGIHKGLVVPAIVRAMPPGAAIVAVGDDLTDEDLFRATGEQARNGFVVRVGPREGAADLHLDDPHAARAWLRRFT